MNRFLKIVRTAVLVFALGLSSLNGSSNIAYQGVAFNAGAPVVSGTISLRFTILASDGTTIKYQETKSSVPTTDKGFFSHQIGSGTRTAGATTLDDVTWEKGYKLKVEVDYANGTSYTNLGTQDFTTAPYAKGLDMDPSFDIKVLTADAGITHGFNPGFNLSSHTAARHILFASEGGTTRQAMMLGDTSTTSTGDLFGLNISGNSGSTWTKVFTVSGNGDLYTTGDTYLNAGDVVKLNGSMDENGGGAEFYGFGSSGDFQVSVDDDNSTQKVNFTIDKNGLLLGTYNTLENNSSMTQYPLRIFGKGGANGDQMPGIAFTTYTTVTEGSVAPGAAITFKRTDASSKGELLFKVRTTTATTASANLTTALTITDSANIVASGTVTASGTQLTSDKRIKTAINPIENAIEKIKQIKPSSYYLKDATKDSRIRYGFIAQELEEVMPEAVNTGDGIVDGVEVNDFRTVNYTMVFTQAVAAIQEQQKIIESQDTKIKALEEKLNTIIKTLNK